MSALKQQKLVRKNYVQSVEKMITLGKRGDLHARRQAASYIRNEVANEENGQSALQKLFSDIATSLRRTSRRIHSYHENWSSPR